MNLVFVVRPFSGRSPSGAAAAVGPVGVFCCCSARVDIIYGYLFHAVDQRHRG